MTRHNKNRSARTGAFGPLSEAEASGRDDEDRGAFQAAKRAKETHEEELINRSDVIAVAVGLRSVKGEQTDEPSVTVFVEKKLPLAELPKERVLPRSLSLTGAPKVTIDVVTMQPPTSPPLNHGFTLRDATSFLSTATFGLWQSFRPAFGGVSIAHYLFPIGTLTLGVRDKFFPNTFCALSCSHVLARIGAAQVGDAILQPAPMDGGIYPRDMIAALSRFVPFTINPNGFNLVDAAIAAAPANALLPTVYGFGAPPAVRRKAGIQVGETVFKVGRGSGLTSGTIVGVNATVKVNYASLGLANQTFLFREQILTTLMSAYGDSGSLLFDSAGNAVGLLFGGSATNTLFNYMENVQNELSVLVADRLI